MGELKQGLPPLPLRLENLPISDSGYPVPWFVGYVDGVPDFRCSDARKFRQAIRDDLCWMCGERNGAYKVFVIGPMCAVNRVTGEPPCHLACAEYAATACPFLVNPKRRRRENDLPEKRGTPGIPILRNPGVTLLWSTKKFRPFRAGGGGNGVMFSLGVPAAVWWYCEGREATDEEIIDSIEGGIPILRDMAAVDGPVAIAELESQIRAARKLLPTTTREA